MRKAFIDDCT